MENPIVSIIIPSYNTSQFLPDAIQSVINQTFHKWEIIIVDDGSTDDIDNVVKQFLNSKIKYFKKSNGGLADARNFGINKAEGLYILPLDADDIIEKTYIEKAINCLEKDKDLKLVYCKASFFGAKEGEWILEEYNFRRLLTNNMIFCSAIFRKNDFITAGEYSVQLINGLEDWDLWIRLLNDKSKVYQLPEILFFYRKHKGTSMSDQFSNRFQHNQTLNQIFDLNRLIYERHFGNPILVARSLLVTKEKFEKLNHTFPVRIFKFIRKVQKKLFRLFK